MSQSRYAQLSRQELAVLLPELLLIGQMIDRSGMAWCIQEFGRDEMVQIAIEEWAGASPIYTRRMQRALNYEGVDVPTIFKGLQLDIGAPPQFMDFRYNIHDRWHGEFHLDHCGALLDVEPMGDEYVFGMCHTIEDPTFDATAVATNARAQVRRQTVELGVGLQVQADDVLGDGEGDARSAELGRVHVAVDPRGGAEDRKSVV